MKQKTKVFFILLLLLLFLLAIFFYIFKKLTIIKQLESDHTKVAIVFSDKNDPLLAFESLLEEEGVPFVKVSVDELMSSNPEKITSSLPAILFPDGVNQRLHPDVLTWVKKYLNSGGSIFISYDVGVKNYKGAYLKKALFTELLGINYILYPKLKEKSYSSGFIEIQDRDFLEIPPGKIDSKKHLITGYMYGKLTYPYARGEILSFKGNTLASIVDEEDGSTYPAIAYTTYGKGYIYYVNTPAGYLKAYSDDLILRSNLRTFLFKLVKVPHLVNTPMAKGGLIINWHVDANPDWISIPMMVEKGYIRKKLKYSFHITAGDFRDSPGDNLGFDACGKGRSLVKLLMNYGVIGSHGGWGHNWFSTNLEKGIFGKKEIYEYIKKNNDCLESITGYKIREYAAPNGVHPQPETTKVLERLGMVAYYYTGDSGSSPNRTFIGGKMVSNQAIAFPIVPYGTFASLYEMYKSNTPEKDVFDFLKDLVDYVEKRRTIRLFYSHPYDIPNYPNAVLQFIDYLEEKKNSGKIEVNSVSYFADFLKRFLNTSYEFKPFSNKLVVEMKNPYGLKEIALAIPKEYNVNRYLNDKNIYGIDEDSNYYYIFLKKNPKSFVFIFDRI